MNLRLFVLVSVIIGLALCVYSLTPYYKDPKEFKLNPYEETSEYSTCREYGVGIATSSGTILLFLLLTKIKTFADLKNTKSLNKRGIFLWSNSIYLLSIPPLIIWIFISAFAKGQGELPFAFIPAWLGLFIMMLISMNVFIFLTTIKSSLPTKLFVRANIYNYSVIFWELFFGFCLIINLWIYIMFVFSQNPVLIFVTLFFTYVLLNLRAGQISKYNPDVPMN